MGVNTAGYGLSRLLTVLPSIHPDAEMPHEWVNDPVPAPPNWFFDLLTEHLSKPRRKSARGSRFSSGAPVDAVTGGLSWAGVLVPHGCECLDLDPDEDGSRRRHPAVTSSCSATIRPGGLFVYSANTTFEVTEPGSPEGYKKFRACVVLNHQGDLSAAARALGKEVAR